MSDCGPMPVGVPIKVFGFDERHDKSTWISIIVLYATDKHYFIKRDDGIEKLVPFSVSKSYKWVRQLDPQKELFNKILSEWKSESLENAYDTKESLVSIEYMFNWLVENGYIEVEK